MTFAYGDVLAGPIVRRVEPTLAAVWVALRKPASVVLRIYDGIKEGDTTDAPLATAEADTVPLGAELHLALPTVVLANAGGGAGPGGRLLSDRIYAYDIVLRERNDAGGAGQGLRALGLLDEGEADGRPRLPLGYRRGRLPAFVLPPANIALLSLLVGSCRMGHSPGPDGMPHLDDVLAKDDAYLDPAKRPHQLFLTGDQIYADEIAPELLALLTPIGNRLLAGGDRTVERLPFEHKLGERDVWPIPLTIEHFPPARRQRLIRRQAGLTSSAGDAHLLGLGEFASMYLMGWSNVLWPADCARRAERAPAADGGLQDPLGGPARQLRGSPRA